MSGDSAQGLWPVGRVLIKSVSQWQKPGCLFCDEPATHEAFGRRDEHWTASIRCCAGCTTAAAQYVEEWLARDAK